MTKTYTTTKRVKAYEITLDGDDVQVYETVALVIESSGINPTYPIARNTTREQWTNIAHVLRKLDSDLRPGDHSTIGNRAALQRTVRQHENRHGYVGVYWAGTDCDGARWRRSYAHPSHLLRSLERELELDAEWLDGPANYCLSSPTLSDVIYCAHQYGYRLPFNMHASDFPS